MTTTEQRTRWYLKGRGYEFCNCSHGCGCNFAGFPTSADGSCKAMVGNEIVEGSCGDVDLSGVKAIAVIDWPKAIHDGDGKAVFVVDPATTDEQIDCLSQIYTGQLGGDPWAILGTTYTVTGLVKAPITFAGEGVKTEMTAEGVGRAKGDSLKNPVTGEEHQAQIVLPDGFIWRKGEVGTGTFEVEAGGIHLDFADTNWILYEFDWSND
jgi:hypothetical protein